MGAGQQWGVLPMAMGKKKTSTYAEGEWQTELIPGIR